MTAKWWCQPLDPKVVFGTIFGSCMQDHGVKKARVESGKHWEKLETFIQSFEVFGSFQNTHTVSSLPASLRHIS